MKYPNLIVVIVALFCAVAHATVWYVHPDSAMNCIQDCLDSCDTGDTVLVGAGTYMENIIWPSTDGIRLMSEYGPDTTIIDGSNPPNADTGSVLIFMNQQDTTSVLQGFTITNGSGTVHSMYPQGGGIYCISTSSPKIINNIITGNTAFWGGGGISCYSGSSPIIDGNTVSYNVTDTAGGGVMAFNFSNPNISNNTILMNQSRWGGGLYIVNASDPEITNNEILNNTATINGGGVGITWGSAPIFSNNLVRGNKASYGGGGLYCGESSTPLIVDCTIDQDTAYIQSYGGGIRIRSGSTPIVTNCDISNNSGAGVSCEQATATISHCTISYNATGVNCLADGIPTIDSCNITDNVGYAVWNSNAASTVIAENNWWGDSTGPYHPTANPGGLGDTVSDYVDFDPWLLSHGIEEIETTKPLNIALQIHPNPFTDRTQIRFTIHDSRCTIGNTELGIYDASGRLVKSFNHESCIMDHESVTSWDGTDDMNRRVASGVYFVTLSTDDHSEVRKVLLIR